MKSIVFILALGLNTLSYGGDKSTSGGNLHGIKSDFESDTELKNSLETLASRVVYLLHYVDISSESTQFDSLENPEELRLAIRKLKTKTNNDLIYNRFKVQNECFNSLGQSVSMSSSGEPRKPICVSSSSIGTHPSVNSLAGLIFHELLHDVGVSDNEGGDEHPYGNWFKDRYENPELLKVNGKVICSIYIENSIPADYFNYKFYPVSMGLNFGNKEKALEWNSRKELLLKLRDVYSDQVVFFDVTEPEKNPFTRYYDRRPTYQEQKCGLEKGIYRCEILAQFSCEYKGNANQATIFDNVM